MLLQAVSTVSYYFPSEILTISGAGGAIKPPGFDPPMNLESVVTYLAIAFTNVSTFLQGLGIGIVMGRDDNTQGGS
jgi:hypothetical protein